MAAPAPAAVAYSVATADYTIEQLEGEACTQCGEAFEPGQVLERVYSGDDYDLYVHAAHETAVKTR